MMPRSGRVHVDPPNLPPVRNWEIATLDNLQDDLNPQPYSGTFNLDPTGLAGNTTITWEGCC